MRAVLATSLMILLVYATVAQARMKSMCPILLEAAAPEPSATSAEAVDAAALKRLGNRFRNQHAGVMVTPVLGRGAPEARRVKAYLQKILDDLGATAIPKASIHVVVNIYSSTNQNAFATNGSELPVQRKYLGLAEDGRPIFEIGFLQGLLSFFKTEDELAFVMGHELGHVISGHLAKGDGTMESDLGKWISSQSNEIEADLAALEYMRGKYNLESALATLERLLRDEDPNQASYLYFGSSHHHPSVRLASILARIQHLRRSDPHAAPRPERSLRRDLMVAKRSPRDSFVTPEHANFRDAYWNWFDALMARRETKIYLHSSFFSSGAFQGNDRLMADATNSLFSESLVRIRALPLTNPEKLERIFELLMVYREALYTARDESVAEMAIEFIGGAQRADLERHLRELSFGDDSDWSPSTLVAEFDRRVVTARSRRGARLTAEALGDLVSHKRIQRIFVKFAKVSRRWREFIASPLHSAPTLSLAELESVLNRSLTHAFTPESLRHFISELNAYSLRDKMTSPEAIETVQNIYMVGLQMRESVRSTEIGRAVDSWLQLYAKDLKAALRTEFDRLLGVDLAKLSENELIQITGAMNGIFSHEPFRTGLTKADLPGRSRDLQRWLKTLRRLAPKKARIYGGQTESVAVALLTADLPAMANRARAKLKFMNGLDDLNVADTGPYLETLSEAELFGLLDLLPRDELKLQKYLPVLSRLTSLGAPHIRRLGLTNALIESVLAHGVSADELGARLKADKSINDQISDAVSKIRSAQWRYRNLLGSVEVTRRLDAKLSAERLEGLTRYKAHLVEQEINAELLIYPHLIGQDWVAARTTTLSPHSSFLLCSLVNLQERGISLDQWSRIYHNLILGEKIPTEALPLSLRDPLRQFLTKHLAGLSEPDRADYLLKPHILSLLQAEVAAQMLADHFIASAQMDSTSSRKERYENLRRTLKLPAQYPDVDALLKQRVAERLRLQPGEINAFFEPDDHPQVHGAWVRGMSGIVAEVQRRSIEDQIAFIEYVTGRSDQAPTSIGEIAERIRTQIDASVQFEDLVTGARARLARAKPVERGLVLLPFFTGATAMLASPGGQDILLNRVLAAVSPTNRPLARRLAEGILEAEGRSRPLVFALIYGLKGESNKPLSEGDILRALFSYGYGVPGIKFAQYLAFTSGFKTLLGELQDRALPLSYFEAIKLIEGHFPRGLPHGLRVIGVKGSGSVNVAIEYFDPLTDANEVLTVPREGVETATKEDFRRLKNALIEVIRDPEGRARFGFMLGLLDTIQASVELEFDRARVYQTHRKLAKILDRTVGGWHVKMVDPIELMNGQLIRMKMAGGVPARIVDQRDPRTYRSAMRAASTVISDHLLRRKAAADGEYFADSDFHDGQAFIDARSRTVWLIDPGQAIAINLAESRAAEKILRVLAKTLQIDDAVNELNESILNPRPGSAFYTRAELAPLLSGADANDAFIRLISLTSGKGSRIPLPTVQWVLGMNRQLALGRRIDSHLDRRLWLRFARASALGTVSHPARALRDAVALLHALWSARE